MFYLEDVFLLLIKDANDSVDNWMMRWEVSYPTLQSLEINPKDDLSLWQKTLREVFLQIPSQDIMVVAHSAACAAFLSWVFEADVLAQKRIRGAILAAPTQKTWAEDTTHTLDRAYVNFPTALVVGKNDPTCPLVWAQNTAFKIGAKCIETPYAGHLNTSLNGWEWGMKLMQDILRK